MKNVSFLHLGHVLLPGLLSRCCTCVFVTRSFSWAHYALIDLGVGDEGIGGLRERWGRMKGPERRYLVYTDSQIRTCKMQRTLKTKFPP